TCRGDLLRIRASPPGSGSADQASILTTSGDQGLLLVCAHPQRSPSFSRNQEVELTVPAILALADGSIFRGIAIGATGETVGEVVFNTAMTGYQEILTDPSYTEQIVTLTYPHIGNTGINPEDVESDRVWAAGLIIRDASMIMSSWRATRSLGDYLREHKVVAIADIDTRRLTRILR